MITKAFNEKLLWKGTLQRAEYPTPVRKSPMNLPKYNPLTGNPHPTNDRLHDEHCASAHKMSQEYWAAEKIRREMYREHYRGATYVNSYAHSSYPRRDCSHI